MSISSGNDNRVRVYRDKRFKWRWQIKAHNGKIIGASTQGYWRRVDCTTNMHRVQQALMPPIRWEQ